MLRAISTITAALVIGLSALGGVATASGGDTGYPAGQCTAYVASQLSWVPSDWGNADLWLIDGRRSGFTTVSGADVVAVHPGDVAVIAAGAQTRNGKASDDGHVGIVTAVDQSVGTVTLSSENWPEGDTQPRSLTVSYTHLRGLASGRGARAWDQGSMYMHCRCIFILG